MDFATCQGNVWVRNKAIGSFRKGKSSKKGGKETARARVLLLSLENAASGTNLTEVCVRLRM
jgi:hypothetical protein